MTPSGGVFRINGYNSVRRINSKKPASGGGIFDVTLVVADDTLLDQSDPDDNGGIYITVFVDGDRKAKSLLRFDLSSIPSGATCNSATLNLYSAGNYAASRSTYILYKISDANGDWVEGTKNRTTAGAGEPCWDYKEYNTGAWAGSAGLETAGTDYINTVLASRESVLGDTPLVDELWAIPFNSSGLTVLESMFGQATNNGFLLYVNDKDLTQFRSKENGEDAYRPTITINYTA